MFNSRMEVSSTFGAILGSRAEQRRTYTHTHTTVCTTGDEEKDAREKKIRNHHPNNYPRISHWYAANTEKWDNFFHPFNSFPSLHSFVYPILSMLLVPSRTPFPSQLFIISFGNVKPMRILYTHRVLHGRRNVGRSEIVWKCAAPGRYTFSMCAQMCTRGGREQGQWKGFIVIYECARFERCARKTNIN